ncbi:MAG TPA: nucleotide exchange factor GrpE [Xanthobacteraceae bacterium]|nr:nucleotide exchange factor GrpE [Xanthobacteraceae bacterium]
MENRADPPAATENGEGVADTAAPANGPAAKDSVKAPEAPPQPQAGEAAAPQDKEAADAKETVDFRDRWLRALAEMENLRRRTEREIADARAYGIAAFARDMISVADNMRRALAATPAELRQSAEAGVKSLIDGVELTERELAKALEKHGIRRLEPMGQKFDPHLHQAMLEVPDESVPAGTVVQVMQDGYTIGERVLRPALVGVAKGGPKPTPVAESANDNSEKAE